MHAWPWSSVCEREIVSFSSAVARWLYLHIFQMYSANTSPPSPLSEIVRRLFILYSLQRNCDRVGSATCSILPLVRSRLENVLCHNTLYGGVAWCTRHPNHHAPCGQPRPVAWHLSHCRSPATIPLSTRCMISRSVTVGVPECLATS